MRTLGVDSPITETKQCRYNVEVLRKSYGINLATKSGSFDDNWTTTRVYNVLDAMGTIGNRIGGASRVKRAFGNTTLSAGAGGLVGCASTESGTSIDWGECAGADDPYSTFNIIHEFGHVLKFRNDGYASGTPRQVWDRMLSLTQPTPLEGLNYYTDERSAFFPIHAGFSTTARQNRGEGGRNHDEEIADMFLFWVVSELSFDLTSDAGRLRQQFVDGFETDNFQDTGISVTNIGMRGWIERAAGGGGEQASLPISPTLVALVGQIPNGECLNLPFMNSQFLV